MPLKIIKTFWKDIRLSLIHIYRVTNKILELSHGKIYTYEAKYSQFLEMKAEREEMELASEKMCIRDRYSARQRTNKTSSGGACSLVKAVFDYGS